MKQPGKKAAAERARAARRVVQLRKEAEDRAAEPEDATTPTTAPASGTGYKFTAEDITTLRDAQGLSWRQVAINLDIGSPGAARTAYTKLTGVDYKDSNPKVRKAKPAMGSVKMSTSKVHVVNWTDDTDQDEILGKLDGPRRLIVQRDLKGVGELEEDLRITGVRRLAWDGKNEDGPLVVTVTEKDSGGARTFRITEIKEVR